MICLCVVLSLVLSMMLCACGGAETGSEDLQVNVGEALEDLETLLTQEPIVETKNEFFNDSNNFYENGQVNIRPRYMYWDGNILVAECYVINGLDTPVTNIVVNDLDFSNASGLIADAQFGTLQDVTLQPYTHILWTFKFGSDVVLQAGGDLSSISYHSNVSFDH